MTNRDRAELMLAGRSNISISEIERALDEKDAEWKLLAGELANVLVNADILIESMKTDLNEKLVLGQSIKNILAKARAIFDDSKQREAGLE